MMVDVYLEGDFPASFRQLRNETEFLLQEFRKINPKIDYRFIDPLKKKMSRDTLEAMGMQPSILPNVQDGKMSEIVLFPYAAVKSQNNGISVPLIVQQSGIDAAEQLNKSIENLEYNLVSNIKNISQRQKKNIGVLVNQDELGPNNFRGFMEMALENYNAGPVIPANGHELTNEDFPKLKKLQALVIAKPRKAFTDGEKLLLDQYIMNGGKTLWMMDAVNAEMDTLFQANKIMAYPIDLNLTDFFFNYGIRINASVIKDMKQSALIRLKTGEISGNPQFSTFLWPYFPLGISTNENPLTKNINPVKFEFPTSIDTLGAKGLKTQVLYETSTNTVVKRLPNFIALSEIVRADSIGEMEGKSAPKILAASVEGKFRSAYANRFERNNIPNFQASSPENKMIIIADGDVGRNQLLKGEALPLGVDLMTNQQYGNEQFLRNCLDYLLDDENLMEIRNRNIDAHLLDRRRIDDERTYWQWLNLLLPVVFAIGLGVFFQWWRKRKMLF